MERRERKERRRRKGERAEEEDGKLDILLKGKIVIKKITMMEVEGNMTGVHRMTHIDMGRYFETSADILTIFWNICILTRWRPTPLHFDP